VLAPSAPIYPIAAARGPLPPGGLAFDVAGDCFRRERAKSIGCNLSACGNSSRSGRLNRLRIFASIGSRVRPKSPAHSVFPLYRGRKRPVLRPRRRDGRTVPGGAGAEIRDARPESIGGIAERVHELQLSPRSLRTDLGPQKRKPRARPYRMRGVRRRPVGRRTFRDPRDRCHQVAGDGEGQSGVVRPTHHRRLGLSRSVRSKALRSAGSRRRPRSL
jgi:hypothetical protein